MGYRYTILVTNTDGTQSTYVKHCYQFKKTKMHRQLIQMLNKNKIESFKYGIELPF